MIKYSNLYIVELIDYENNINLILFGGVMELRITENIRKKDHKKAIQFAIDGMHFQILFGGVMELRITENIRKKDHKKAIQFAIDGMHFHWYFNNNFFLNLYGKYFWYSEMLKATQILAVYADEEFAGVLLAGVKGEKRKYHSFCKSLYVKAFEAMQHLLAKDSAGEYERVNNEMFEDYCKKNNPDGEIVFLAANPDIKIKGIGTMLLEDSAGEYERVNNEMFEDYCKKNNPDGEIVFLAANPDIKIKGIGTMLLEEFERREKGKKVYLYTDDACTYQFYDHRGFERAGEKDIVMDLGYKKMNLKCFLYSKEIK